MRHRIVGLTIALSAFAFAACSRHDNADVASDTKDTGNALSRAAKDLAHDPNLKRAEADLKAIGHDLGADARSPADRARGGARRLAVGARRAAHNGDKRERDSNG